MDRKTINDTRTCMWPVLMGVRKCACALFICTSSSFSFSSSILEQSTIFCPTIFSERRLQVVGWPTDSCRKLLLSPPGISNAPERDQVTETQKYIAGSILPLLTP